MSDERGVPSLETRPPPRHGVAPVRRRRWIWRILLGLLAGGLLLLLGAGLWLWSIEPKITIGKDTTHIERPLDPQGRVDYLAAVRDLSQQGVTPETNQAIVLTRIMPPGELSNANLWNEFHRGLELEPLRDTPPGSQITRFNTFVQDLPVRPLSEEELNGMVDRATSEPWSRKDLPLVWSWVDRHTAALELGVEASRRPHYYAPPISSGTPRVTSIALPLSMTSRYVAQALTARAMLRLHEGDVEAAWHDVMAVFRLGRAPRRCPPGDLPGRVERHRVDGCERRPERRGLTARDTGVRQIDAGGLGAAARTGALREDAAV